MEKLNLTGFHDYYGGIHLKYKIYPDIAIFGKSIANGYPISAIIGKKKIMNKSQDSFISSTMWTDRTGFVAALETLNYMEKNNTQKKLVDLGKFIKKEWTRVAKLNGINLSTF